MSSRNRLLALAFALTTATAMAAPVEVAVRNAAGAPVQDVAVYAIPASGPVESKGRTASIEQVDREFVPFLTVVQAGTTVDFPNRDPIAHHVYSFSPAKSFEIKLYKGAAPYRVLFDKPGVVVLGCNIHDWMLAYVLVVPTPHFARTNARGMAHLDLPHGSYDLRAWHPLQKGDAPPRSISVEGPAAAMFTLEVGARKTRYKPPLDATKHY